MSLTVFDMAVLFVVGVSGLLALMRGLVRESLSIIVWIVSALIAYVAFPQLRAFVGGYIANVWVGDAVTLIIVFLAPLICLKIVAMVIADTVPMGLFGSLDRILGAGYGFARGALIVSLAYLGLNLVNAPEHHPTWIKQARFLPYVQDGAEILASWVPEDMLDPDNWLGMPEGGLGGRPAAAETLPTPLTEHLDDLPQGDVPEDLER
ncbi:MAG: CvpA family protein [Alphaproteobacteria bacterium]|nr:CvpA family protein [Alphaproteobacteria bacterium]